MCEGSGCTIYIDSSSVPLLSVAQEYAAMGLVPANAYRNRKNLEGKVQIAASVSESLTDLLYDPQTSGGLLYAVDAKQVDRIMEDLKKVVPEAAVIGYADTLSDHPICVF